MKRFLLYQSESETKDFMITFNEKILNELGLEKHQELTLTYGKRKQEVVVKVHSLLDEERVFISSNIKTSLLIDLDVKYEFSLKNNELIIGPVIGLLLGKTETRLEKNLHHYVIYTMLYEQINGVLFVFSEDQIDFDEEKISGYIYDPSKENNWRKADLPFPGAIYRRVELASPTLKKLNNCMGKSFFNSNYFDKWQFWKWLEPCHELVENLPKTTKKINLHAVDEFIDRYKGAYLKPKSGSRGKGIHYIEKEDEHYIISKNYEDESKKVTTEEMRSFLRKHYYYLLQEPIRLHTYENRKVDYRVILQKNHTGFWQCTGMIARFGQTNAISSNFKANGFAKDGISALKLQFGYDELTAFNKYQEIVRICTKMAQRVDQVGGGYADLGIDVGIDEDEKILVIEMNKRHDHDFPLMIKDRKMYYLVKSNPVLYAKYLAMSGFKDGS